MNEKQEILNEIEALLGYKEAKLDIDPKLLEYLEIEDLQSIRSSLLAKVGVLSEDDKEWLKQFKKYE